MLRALLERNLDELRGEKLKRHADTLDAMLWAYLAWHCWRWGEERNELFGTLAVSWCRRCWRGVRSRSDAAARLGGIGRFDGFHRAQKEARGDDGTCQQRDSCGNDIYEKKRCRGLNLFWTGLFSCTYQGFSDRAFRKGPYS
jgi:hypothetical protein